MAGNHTLKISDFNTYHTRISLASSSGYIGNAMRKCKYLDADVYPGENKIIYTVKTGLIPDYHGDDLVKAIEVYNSL